jgi:hypothetical protein
VGEICNLAPADPLPSHIFLQKTPFPYSLPSHAPRHPNPVTPSSAPPSRRDCWCHRPLLPSPLPVLVPLTPRRNPSLESHRRLLVGLLPLPSAIACSQHPCSWGKKGAYAQNPWRRRGPSSSVGGIGRVCCVQHHGFSKAKFIELEVM